MMDPDFFSSFIGMWVNIDYKADEKTVLYINGVLGKIVENKLVLLHRDGRLKGFVDISSVVNMRADEIKDKDEKGEDADGKQVL